MTIPDDVVEEVRDCADILSVIGDYVNLRKRGSSWIGLCPFHAEKTPSFNVSPDKGMFYCFGCGIGGNVFTFLMKIENFTFEESVRSLAGRFGVAIPGNNVTQDASRRREKTERISGAIEEASWYYYNILLKSRNGDEGRRYLKSRGYGIDIAKTFRLGWAPRGWDNIIKYLKHKGFSESEIESAGLAVRKDNGGWYDRFRGRIIFPIFSVQNRVLGFGGRLVGGEKGPKYLNSPETEIYKKSEVLYGLHAAKNGFRERDSAIIVEGYFDCIALHKHGFTNAVATCGTSMTHRHVRIISRYTKNIYPLFDADDAGRKAARRALEVILNEGAMAYYVTVPQGDPDSFLADEGPEKMKNIIKNAPPMLGATVDSIINSMGSGVEERQKALKEIGSLFACMSDKQAMELYIHDTAPKLMPTSPTDAVRLLRDEVARSTHYSRKKPESDKKTETVKFSLSREIQLVALCLQYDEAMALLKSGPELIEDFNDAIAKSLAIKLIESNSKDSVLNSLDADLSGLLARKGKELAKGIENDQDRTPDSDYAEISKNIRIDNIKRMKREIMNKLDKAQKEANHEEQIKWAMRMKEIDELEEIIKEGGADL